MGISQRFLWPSTFRIFKLAGLPGLHQNFENQSVAKIVRRVANGKLKDNSQHVYIYETIGMNHTYISYESEAMRQNSPQNQDMFEVSAASHN